MKLGAILVSLALCLLPAAVLAQAATPVASAAAKVAFEIEISAPDDIQALLQQHLDLQRYRDLADLSPDELQRLMDMAQQDAEKLLASQGYFSPSIDIQLDLGQSASAVPVVRMQVAPGEPAQVEAVQLHFVGPIAQATEDDKQRALIAAGWQLPVGSRFTQDAWAAAKQQALNQLISQRYPTGVISASQADVDPQSHSVKLELTLDSGPAYQLGELIISGQNHFDADLVRRLARLPLGGAYQLKELMAAQQRLTASGFFAWALVRLDTHSDPQAARVLVTVREAKLQKLTLGAGVNSDSGARLSLEHLHQQVPGLGWRALSKLALERETQSVSLDFTAPPDDGGWRRNASVLLKKERRSATSQRWRLGAGQLGDHIDRSYYLEYDLADSNKTSRRRSISVSYAFTERQFDSLPFAASGWALGLELGAGVTLGQQKMPFSRILLRGQGLWSPVRPAVDASPAQPSWRLAGRAQLGAVAIKDSGNLPATLLFLAGGTNSVRGYSLRSLGVVQPDGSVAAGRYLRSASIEWQRPISVQGRLTDWESDIFVDAGSVADRVSDLRLKLGVGAGARWKSPVGLLQIDLAYGLTPRRWRLHLNLGFVF